MAMRLTKATDAAHKRLSILIDGEPKVGKTTLAKTLPLTSDDKLFYVAADPGQLALRDREFVVARPENGELTEKFFNEVLEHIRQHGNLYEWIFVDGVDEIADAILREKLQADTNSLRAFGRMAEYIERWLKAIRDTEGVNVVFVTHLEKVEMGEGEIKFVPSFPGKEIQRHINEWFDMIGCLRLVKGDGGDFKRVIQFRQEADMRFMVGDRSGVTRLLEPPDLGAIVKKIHEAGFETKGTWQEPKPSAEQLKALAALAVSKGKTTDDVKALATKMFDTAVRDLTLEQFEQLRRQVEEGVAS